MNFKAPNRNARLPEESCVCNEDKTVQKVTLAKLMNTAQILHGYLIKA